MQKRLLPGRGPPALAASLLAAPLHAQTAFPATLAGHVVMPAQSFIAAPKDAPQDLKNADDNEMILLEVGDFLKAQ